MVFLGIFRPITWHYVEIDCDLIPSAYLPFTIFPLYLTVTREVKQPRKQSNVCGINVRAFLADERPVNVYQSLAVTVCRSHNDKRCKQTFLTDRTAFSFW